MASSSFLLQPYEQGFKRQPGTVPASSPNSRKAENSKPASIGMMGTGGAPLLIARLGVVGRRKVLLQLLPGSISLQDGLQGPGPEALQHQLGFDLSTPTALGHPSGLGRQGEPTGTRHRLRWGLVAGLTCRYSSMEGTSWRSVA